MKIASPVLLCVLTCSVLLIGAMPLRAVEPVPAHANVRRAAVDVLVAPERADWTYQVGEAVRFRVAVIADNAELTGLSLKVKVGPESLEQIKPDVVAASGLLIDGGKMTAPGFLRCIVTVDLDGKTYRGLGTAGMAPEKIQPTQTNPADFDAFWKTALADLSQVPIEPEMTLLPELTTSKVNTYHVSFRTAARNSESRLYGILCVPKAPGSYPAVLRVPGAGVRRYTGMVDVATAGAITLEIGIHGIPVNYPVELYDRLRYGALQDYAVYQLDDPQSYYFRRVVLGCVRAVDFLVAQPGYDGKNLTVTGGSQGGFLAIATAALDPRVKRLAAAYPAYSDVTGYLHGRVGGWPHMFRPRTNGEASLHATRAKIATTSYYDTVNFARRVRVPGFYMWGYNDEVCPPTSMYSVYNVITAPKELLLTLKAGHSAVPEGQAVFQDWIIAHLRAN